MTSFFKRFAQDESGAVTVDFVVLTAAVVGLAVAVGGTIFGQVETIATNIDTELTNQSTLDTTNDGS